MKLAWEILNVFVVYWMGFWWVLYPFPCNVLVVDPLGTLALAPSELHGHVVSQPPVTWLSLETAFRGVPSRSLGELRARLV